MNNSIRKTFAALTLLLFGLTWTTTALASTYLMPIGFAHELTSVPRYFDGQNIAFEATPHTYPDSHYPDAKPMDNVYKVTLKRQLNWPNAPDTIGTATLPRNSFGKAIWTNVGPGNYYIFFEKYKDRMIVDDDYAKIYNF